MQSALAVSDNAATDVLLDHFGIEEMTRRLAAWGHQELVVRHAMRALYGAHGAVARVGLGLTAGGSTRGGGHVLAELDPHRANAGTARALVALLAEVWSDQVATPLACARLRRGMSHQLARHRLGGELISDEVEISSKTGTFLDLRHEAGVISTPTREFAMAVLTRSEVPAAVQMESDLVIAHAARLVIDALR